MPVPEPAPEPLPAAAPDRGADWEAFYRDYRKPGYVSGFEITSKLGGGMFGLVFRARKQSIGKDYAIKFLQVDDTEVRRAVLAELEQVKWFAQIDHPNLVSIEDRGEVDGIPYLVMSFAGTETLRDRMPADGAPPPPAVRDELVRYFLQCCRGLSALHERSLVHFDIKPANVFLKGPVARLGDYGLSKLVTHSRGSLSMGRGTPYYMAPELLQRRGDARSDVYSLGVLLYEILCGRVPFTGDSEWEVLRQHETKVPELPAHLSALERAVLQRCLQKDPAHRFQSVHDLIAAFGSTASAGAAAWQDVREGVPVPPPLPPRAFGTRSQKPAEDHLAGLGRASLDVARHAKHVAEDALGKASHALRRTTGSWRHRALKALQDDGALSALRRWRSRWRLKELRKQRRRKRQQLAKELAVRSRGSWLGRTVALLALVMLVTLPFLTTRGAQMQYSASAVASAPPPPPAATNAAIYDVFDVPAGFGEVVSLSEPRWVSLARRDRSSAHDTLLAHIASLRRAAPLSPADRARTQAIPTFRLSHAHTQGVWQANVALEELLRGDQYPENVARRMDTADVHVIVAAAAMLADVQWLGPAEVERASRLHRFLVEATGCRDIAWIDSGSRSWQVLGRENRDLGRLWVWFTNEFAHTQRTWATYRTLLRRQ